MFASIRMKSVALLMSIFWLVSPCANVWSSNHIHPHKTSKGVNTRKMTQQKSRNQQKFEKHRAQEVVPDLSPMGAINIKPQYVVPMLLVMSVAGYYMLTTDQDVKGVTPSHSDLRQFVPEPGVPFSLNVHTPIPLSQRSDLYRDLEDRYCQGELCDEHGGFCDSLNSATKKTIRTRCPQLENAYKKYDSLEDKALLLEDKSLVKIVPQGRYYTGVSGQIVTGNLQKCVGIALYNPETGIGGVAHFAAENLQEVDKFLQGRATTRTGLQTFLSEIMKETDPSALKATLVSGDKAHIEYAARFMKYFGIEDVTRMHKSSWGAPKGNNYFSPNYVCGSVILDLDHEGALYRVANTKELSKVMGPTYASMGPSSLKKMRDEDF